MRTTIWIYLIKLYTWSGFNVHSDSNLFRSFLVSFILHLLLISFIICFFLQLFFLLLFLFFFGQIFRWKSIVSKRIFTRCQFHLLLVALLFHPLSSQYYFLLLAFVSYVINLMLKWILWYNFFPVFI